MPPIPRKDGGVCTRSRSGRFTDPARFCCITTSPGVRCRFSRHSLSQEDVVRKRMCTAKACRRFRGRTAVSAHNHNLDGSLIRPVFVVSRRPLASGAGSAATRSVKRMSCVNKCLQPRRAARIADERAGRSASVISGPFPPCSGVLRPETPDLDSTRDAGAVHDQKEDPQPRRNALIADQRSFNDLRFSWVV